jgi:hypothetical protein
LRRNFRKATLISAAAYAGAVLSGFAIDFRIALFSLAAIQPTWTLFCIARAAQLRLSGGHRQSAEPWQREEYEFALGGSISSLTLLAAVIILTQVV